MTQYLQTQTDIFAAAISHAGISDHTSYWGEGYWGYSYSEVSMANSYPWSNPDLFVKQSPLFNADKIHTPLLFLHGDADVNVPVGESIQMFTALKLLGRETAFVAVTGQDHHIVDYGKRIQWQNTILPGLPNGCRMMRLGGTLFISRKTYNFYIGVRDFGMLVCISLYVSMCRLIRTNV